MVTLHPNKKSTLSISGIVDAQGNPTLPNATPMYIPSQTGTVTLIPTTDGMSCDVVWLASSETPTVVTVGVDGITKTATFQTTGGAVADFTLNEGPEVDA